MERAWQWVAIGKHPVAKDFFRVGDAGSLAREFSQWVDRGYQLLTVKKKGSLCSWRFWTRGPKKDALGCGVVRDCYDQLSRPYPLLILGTGSLPGWEDQWDLNPLACERTWTQMEYLFTKTFAGLTHLEEEIRKIPPPLGRWPDLRASRQSLLEAGGAASALRDFREMERRLSPYRHASEVCIPLDQGLFPDPSQGIHYLHSFLRKEEAHIPQSSFMGGTLENAFLAVFKRPLQPGDFVRLWSVSAPGEAKE
jgi:type VI secretion system protein VasJ